LFIPSNKEGLTATLTPKKALMSEELAELAAQVLAARKAQEPVVIAVKGLCSFADYFIICSGASQRQVAALARHVEEALAQVGVKPLGLEGLEESQWVLMDYHDVVIHIFIQPLREFYDLEGLWAEAPRVALGTESAAKSPRGAAS